MDNNFVKFYITLILSVLDRLEEIRTAKGLNKSQFEKVLGKSTGYVNTLKKQGSLPSIDVLMRISDNYPEVDLRWLLTGEGEMMISEENTLKEDAAAYPVTGADLKKELLEEMQEMKKQMAQNFEAVNEALVLLLKSDHKIQRFVEGMNEAEIQDVAKQLQEYLKDKQEK